MDFVEKYKKFEIFYEEDIDMFTTFIDFVDVSSSNIVSLKEKIEKMYIADESISYTPSFKEIYLTEKKLTVKEKDFLQKLNIYSSSMTGWKSDKSIEDFEKISSAPYDYINKYIDDLENLKNYFNNLIKNSPPYDFELWINYKGDPVHNKFIKLMFSNYKKKIFENMTDYLARICFLNTNALGYCLFTSIAVIKDNEKNRFIDIRTLTEQDFIQEIRENILF